MSMCANQAHLILLHEIKRNDTQTHYLNKQAHTHNPNTQRKILKEDLSKLYNMQMKKSQVSEEMVVNLGRKSETARKREIEE